MTEPKRPASRTRTRPAPEPAGDDNPYLDAPAPRPSRAKASPGKAVPATAAAAPAASAPVADGAETAPPKRPRAPRRPKADAAESSAAPAPMAPVPVADASPPRPATPIPDAPRIERTRPDARREVRESRPERTAESRADTRGAPSFPPSPFDGPVDRGSGDPREPENRYDRAFNRTDGPERVDRPAGQERADRPDRPDRLLNDRRERGGRRRGRNRNRSRDERGERPAAGPPPGEAPFAAIDRPERPERPERVDRPDRPERPERGGDDRSSRNNGRRGRNRFRRGAPGEPRPGAASTPGGADVAFDRAPLAPVAVDGEMTGWFDPSRDGGFLRRPVNSYLPEPTDPFVPPALVRLHQLRRGDKIDVTHGRDPRGRAIAIEVQQLNDGSPVVLEKRSDFNTLTASYPDRKLTLETGRPAKTGPELTRRAIDLIAPIGYGQRALIVAPARAGKTTLLQAIVEGVAINHPQAALLVLLVDERPEEVSEMITWGYGEVVASSFDMPPKRHVEVAEMTLERARRLVEQGKDVVIVLDSITRLARAYNTVDRGTGRTMSGGLDATAMQKPKAFFGSARMIAEQHGGGSLTIIATALVETGSRMDDVIFEEFKGTGNCEIKLDRSLADRRIFPAFDIATSGTRREEKLYRPDQLEKVHLLRRGLHQLPPQAGMEWLIKRIAATSNNDSLLDGL